MKDGASIGGKSRSRSLYCMCIFFLLSFCLTLCSAASAGLPVQQTSGLPEPANMCQTKKTKTKQLCFSSDCFIFRHPLKVPVISLWLGVALFLTLSVLLRLDRCPHLPRIPAFPPVCTWLTSALDWILLSL